MQGWIQPKFSMLELEVQTLDDNVRLIVHTRARWLETAFILVLVTLGEEHDCFIDVVLSS